MKHHLSTLSILHFVYGAILFLGGLAGLFFLGIGTWFLTEVAMEHADPPPPEWLVRFLGTFGIALFSVMLAWSLLVMLSGYWLSAQRNRTASIVVAALSLLSFPLGTALGVYTLVVLHDPDVRAAYDGSAPPV